MLTSAYCTLQNSFDNSVAVIVGGRPSMWRVRSMHMDLLQDVHTTAGVRQNCNERL